MVSGEKFTVGDDFEYIPSMCTLFYYEVLRLYPLETTVALSYFFTLRSAYDLAKESCLLVFTTLDETVVHHPLRI